MTGWWGDWAWAGAWGHHAILMSSGLRFCLSAVSALPLNSNVNTELGILDGLFLWVKLDIRKKSYIASFKVGLWLSF